MKHFQRHALILTLLLSSFFFAGCQGPEVRYYPLNNPVGSGTTPPPATYTAVSPTEVVLYVAKQPTRPYSEMGILAFTSSSNQPNEADIFQKFRDKASEIGADAVVILPSREQNESFWQTTGYPYDWYYGYGSGMGYSSGYSRDLTTFRGLAIKFK